MRQPPLNQHDRQHSGGRKEPMMKRFLVLYNGPPPPASSHEGWPEWFSKIGDRLVDLGSPMVDGVVLRGDGSTSDQTLSLNGYSIIQCDDRGEALDLLTDHPFRTLGSEYTIEVFELPKL